MRIFLAAPTDAVLERAAVERALDTLRQRHEADSVELIDWRSHLRNGAQADGVAADRVTADDVVVGLAWTRFDPDGGEAGVSEREIELAFRGPGEASATTSLFVRSLRAPASLRAVEGEELRRVERFVERLRSGPRPVTVQEADDVDAVENQVVSALDETFARLGSARSAVAPSPAASPPADDGAASPAAATPAEGTAGERPTPQPISFVEALEPGQAYEVTFVAVALAGAEALRERHAPEAMDLLLRNLHRMVTDLATSYGGEVFRWEESGGLLIFWRAKGHDQGVMTGLKLLHNLPVFNLDPHQNPLPDPIHVRLAAHDATIVFQRPPSAIDSPEIAFVGELMRQAASPGELVIGERLLGSLDERLRRHFKPKDRYERQAIHACRLPAGERQGQVASLDDMIEKLRHHTMAIHRLLAPEVALDDAALESLADAIDQCYAILNRFAVAYSQIDRGWSRDFLESLAGAAEVLRGEEQRAWQRLRHRYSAEGVSPQAARLAAVAKAVSRRRSRPVVILEKLEERCRALLRDEGDAEPEAAPAAEELFRKIDALLRADELDDETALTDLLLSKKSEVMEYLVSARGEERHRQLLDKLWRTADLLLLDDLYSIRDHRRADDQRILDVITADPVKDGRFRIVKAALERAEIPTEGQVRRGFLRLGLEPRAEDLQIVWRSVVVGHPDHQQRNAAGLRLSPYSMWQAVSHPRIPIASIYAIGDRVNRKEDDDTKRIFFDCVRARVESAVEAAHNREELEEIARLILLLLDFPFLVETGYFERFDDVLGKFLAKSQATEHGVAFFSNLRATLEKAHQQVEGRDPGPPPARVQKLPLTIQRRLAGEPRYLYWFVTHPDPRIAGETLHHIGLGNVERVLRLREVNGVVMQSLLQKPELFTRVQPLVTALMHPKCTLQFANRYVAGMARSHAGRAALEKLMRNPSSNPQVRSLAKRAIEERGASRARA